MISINNRFILEPYVKEGLKAKVTGGIAMPGQRDALKALKVLIDGSLSNGQIIRAGSVAYIREEILYSHPWSTKVLTLNLKDQEVKCIIAPLEHIEIFDEMSHG